MTARLLSLTVFFVVLFGILGCTASPPETPPQPDEATIPPPQPPKAVPGQPRTQAEMLVGRWKQVKWTPEVIPGYRVTIDYKADGTFTRWVMHPRTGKRVEAATYQLTGETLTHFGYGPLGQGRAPGTATIQSLTEDRLVILFTYEVYRDEKDPSLDIIDRQVVEYERIGREL